MLSFFKLLMSLALAGLLVGCNPVTTAAKLGVKLAGKVISDQSTSKLSSELLGQPPSAADAKLGTPKDVWQDINGPREWRAYPVKYDVLDRQRYMVIVEHGRIVRVELIEKHGGKTSIPQELILASKAKGKSPQECETALGLGRPKVTARSMSTGHLVQLYDAPLIEGLTGPRNALVFFDEQEKCNKVTLVEVEASQG